MKYQKNAKFIFKGIIVRSDLFSSVAWSYRHIERDPPFHVSGGGRGKHSCLLWQNLFKRHVTSGDL